MGLESTVRCRQSPHRSRDARGTAQVDLTRDAQPQPKASPFTVKAHSTPTKPQPTAEDLEALSMVATAVAARSSPAAKRASPATPGESPSKPKR